MLTVFSWLRGKSPLYRIHWPFVKTLAGGLRQRNIDSKCIRHYSTVSEERCLHALYGIYLSLVKSSSDTENDCDFYKRPIPGQCKFSKQSVGINKLSNVVKTMCENADLKGYFTNHSGKCTCATSLFRGGVEEQLICGRPGHRSTAVRAYKRPSTEMQVRVSELLDPPGAHRESKVGCTSAEGELDLPSSVSPQKKALAGISVPTGLPGKFENCTFHINFK